MNWERIKWHGQDGTVAEVYVDQSKSVVKKIFKEGGTTVSGKKTKYSADVVSACFKNEVEWCHKLRSPIKNNKIVAYDFKWAQKAPLSAFWRKKEIECYREYISKIDKTLPTILENMI